ncbi:MAG TPA: hypothetical protein VFH08_13420 [Chitinophagaceae bacterium]|nr:hypothetical protein [Chitinophagaceae bacterium]
MSCKPSDRPKEIDYRGYTHQQVFLKGYDEKFEWNDSLALISLKTHERLDTFYNWEHKSDCSSCGWMKYRFADKSYSQFAERGWLWTFVPDPTYQFNIWHKPIKEAPDSILLTPLSEKDTTDWYYHPHVVGPQRSQYLY